MKRHTFATWTAITVAALLVASCGAPSSPDENNAAPESDELTMPDEPVTLNLVDVAGDIVVAQPMIEAYVDEHPEYVSKVNFETGDATQIVSKLKAQQDAGVLQTDIVLTGNDALGIGVEADVFIKIFPEYEDQLGESVATYQAGAQKLFDMTEGYATVNDFGNYGPLLEFLPDTVPNPPTSADDLLAWAEENPGQFMYAQPANSGPGRAFVQGLPYILGDDDPRDPVDGWDKTWDYLKALDEHIDYYPSGTTTTMKELADGSRSLIASSAGWDINPRAIGTVPKEAEVVAMENTSWVMDGSYIAIPKGQSPEKLAVTLDIINWMLTPDQQAYAYDSGYMYPGPAVEGVELSMAPEESRELIEEYGREDFYDDLLPQYEEVPPLDNQELSTMFDMWDREIGAQKIKD